MLVSLTGVCMGENSPGYTIYVQGGGSSISPGSDGQSVMTVEDIIPYSHITNGVMSYLMPVERLVNMTFPLNAAIVFSGDTGQSTYLVNVSNLSWSAGNKSVSLEIKPLEFYEGDMLKPYGSPTNDVGLDKTGNYSSTGIYIEILRKPVVNSLGSMQDTDCFHYCMDNPDEDFDTCLAEC